MGLLYAMASITAEYYYKWGSEGSDIGEMVNDLRRSAHIFPLDRRFRTSSASFLANAAMQQSDPAWQRIAIPEIRHALQADPTQADILAMLVACDLNLDRVAEAQVYYDQFKRVAKMSPLIQMVKDQKRLAQ